MKQNKEKLGVAIITAFYEVNGKKSYAEIKIGIACAKDFDRKEKKEFTDILINGIKKELQMLLSVRIIIMQN